MTRLAGVSRVARSPWTLLIGVLLVGTSALLGNVFQNADRSSIRTDLADAKAQNEALQEQLDEVKGQQECRARITGESELYSGRLLASLGRLVVASQERDDEAAEAAVTAIAAATVALGPSLDARVAAVELCERNPDYRTPFAEVTADPFTTTTTTTRPTSRPARSTSTTGTTTTSTTFRSSPDPTDPPLICSFLPITVPPEIPCL